MTFFLAPSATKGGWLFLLRGRNPGPRPSVGRACCVFFLCLSQPVKEPCSLALAEVVPLKRVQRYALSATTQWMHATFFAQGRSGRHAIDLCQVEYWAKEGGYNYIILDSADKYMGKLSVYQEVYRIDIDPSKDTNAYDREYILYRLTEEG